MNFRLLNLCMAAVWVLLGMALLAEYYLSPRPRFLVPIGGGISMGWVALVLAVYNLIRWMILGARERAAAPPVSSLARRGRRDPEEYHPEFDFNRPAEPGSPANPPPTTPP